MAYNVIFDPSMKILKPGKKSPSRVRRTPNDENPDDSEDTPKDENPDDSWSSTLLIASIVIISVIFAILTFAKVKKSN